MLCIHCMFKKIWRTDVTLFLLVLVLFQKNSILEQIKFSEPGYVHVTVQMYCPTVWYNFLHNNLRINTARNWTNRFLHSKIPANYQPLTQTLFCRLNKRVQLVYILKENVLFFKSQKGASQNEPGDGWDLLILKIVFGMLIIYHAYLDLHAKLSES